MNKFLLYIVEISTAIRYSSKFTLLGYILFILAIYGFLISWPLIFGFCLSLAGVCCFLAAFVKYDPNDPNPYWRFALTGNQYDPTQIRRLLNRPMRVIKKSDESYHIQLRYGQWGRWETIQVFYIETERGVWKSLKVISDEDAANIRRRIKDYLVKDNPDLSTKNPHSIETIINVQ
jgi:hypothetical protein